MKTATTLRQRRLLTAGRFPRRRLGLGAAAVAAALTAACSSGPAVEPQLELPEKVAKHLEAHEVTSHKGKKLIWFDRIQYGPYRVEDVDRGWTRSESFYFTIGGRRWNLVFRNWKPFAVAGAHWSWQFGEWDGRPDWVGDYGFELSENGAPAFEGQCAMELTAGEEAVSCALRRHADGKVWILALGDVSAVPVADWLPPFVAHPQMAGYLSDETTTYTVLENFGRPNGIPVNLELGYTLARDGQTLAAVDKAADPGRMWLPRRDDDQRDVLAASSAALYLYRGLREELR
ncbi:MAG: hypothetical protein AAGM22_10325 [Acidobacteriota bacterium]